MAIDTAGRLKEICAKLAFRSSTSRATTRPTAARASRSAASAWTRAAILGEVKRQLGVPVLTDVHSIDEIRSAAVVDVLQTPAFLCRQTDFIHARARASRSTSRRASSSRRTT
jgi:2-dehydro-3-deoxyphosphooctonate aldolase (KDO 8-P synthase)